MHGFRLLLFVPLLAPHLYAVDGDATTPQPEDRYAAMAQKSPFALATATAPAAAPVASFAANWYIVGLGKLGDQDYVTIKSRDATQLFSIYGKEPAEGVNLASVEWSETIGRSKVVLRKGTEMATLEFNEEELKGPAGGAPGAAPAPPNPANAGAGANRAVAVPPLPSTATKGQLNIARPPVPPQGFSRQVVTTPAQNTGRNIPNTGQPIIETRRRVMPIPAPASAPPRP